MKHLGNIPRKFLCLINALHQQRQRLVARAALDLVNPLHRAQVHRIGGEAIKGVGWHAQYLSLANALRSVTYKLLFRLAAVDLQEFCRQRRPLVSEV